MVLRYVKHNKKDNIGADNSSTLWHKKEMNLKKMAKQFQPLFGEELYHYFINK